MLQFVTLVEVHIFSLFGLGRSDVSSVGERCTSSDDPMIRPKATLKKSLFPVQRVARIKASREGKSFFF